MKKLTLIIFFVIALQACNKKKTADPVAPPPNNVTSIYQTGVFELLKSQYFDGTSIVTDGEYVTLTFINYDFSTSTSVEVNAGNVNFNGTGLKFDTYNYQDTTYAINYAPSTFTVNVSGSSQISAFTATFNPIYPVFTGDALLPITVSKSVGFTVNLGSSISNVTDTATIHLFTSSLKKIAPGQTSITFTPSDLSGVMIGSGYPFELELVNNQSLNVNGTNYNIRQELLYKKYNINVVP